MPTLGRTSAAALIRTDYSDQEAWRLTLTRALAETKDGFRAYLEIIDDESFGGLTTDAVRNAVTDAYKHTFLIVADRVTMTEPDHPLLVIDRFDEPGRTFRAVPAAIQGIENNLSIANMSFFEFANHVDADGVFREFPPVA